MSRRCLPESALTYSIKTRACHFLSPKTLTPDKNKNANRAEGAKTPATRDACDALLGGRAPRPDDAVPAFRQQRRSSRPGLPPPQRRPDGPDKPHRCSSYLHPRGNSTSCEGFRADDDHNVSGSGNRGDSDSGEQYLRFERGWWCGG